MKTNAARQLDQLGIRYELREYDAGPDHLDAEAVAARVGLPPEQVFKTLVVRGDRTGVLIAVVPANAELDAKALARLSGDRRVELVPLVEVQPLTGYVRGGVTALGANIFNMGLVTTFSGYAIYSLVSRLLPGLPVDGEAEVAPGVRVLPARSSPNSNCTCSAIICWKTGWAWPAQARSPGASRLTCGGARAGDCSTGNSRCSFFLTVDISSAAPPIPWPSARGFARPLSWPARQGDRCQPFGCKPPVAPWAGPWRCARPTGPIRCSTTPRSTDPARRQREIQVIEQQILAIGLGQPF